MVSEYPTLKQKKKRSIRGRGGPGRIQKMRNAGTRAELENVGSRDQWFQRRSYFCESPLVKDK